MSEVIVADVKGEVQLGSFRALRGEVPDIAADVEDLVRWGRTPEQVRYKYECLGYGERLAILIEFAAAHVRDELGMEYVRPCLFCLGLRYLLIYFPRDDRLHAEATSMPKICPACCGAGVVKVSPR